MTTISAKIIADSVSQAGIRLTTMELRYPRCIHAEVKTHRILRTTPELVEISTDLGLMDDENLSRNASSSRAIPVSRLIQDVLDDPFVPVHWGKNQKGMQADEEHDALVPIEVLTATHTGWQREIQLVDRQTAWLHDMRNATERARAWNQAGYHKQLVNRLLEPFAHINVVVTATDWDNFFQLRDHPDAEPHIQILAREMKAAMEGSSPKLLLGHEWHLPYVTDEERREYASDLSTLKKLSVARSASVSYKTVDGQIMTLERAADIYDKLVKADVFHASPFEHQAQPDGWVVVPNRQGGLDFQENSRRWLSPKEHGNFRGWRQLRKQMEKQLS